MLNNFQHASKLSHICDKFDTLLDELSKLSVQDFDDKDFKILHEIYDKFIDRTNKILFLKHKINRIDLWNGKCSIYFKNFKNTDPFQIETLILRPGNAPGRCLLFNERTRR